MPVVHLFSHCSWKKIGFGRGEERDVFRLVRARRQTLTPSKATRAECASDGRERRTRAQEHGSESTRSRFAARVCHGE